MFRNVLADEPSVTYDSRAAAEHALLYVLGPVSGIINYFITATRDGGRYYPVFVAAPNQAELAAAISEHGFVTVQALSTFADC